MELWNLVRGPSMLVAGLNSCHPSLRHREVTLFETQERCPLFVYRISIEPLNHKDEIFRFKGIAHTCNLPDHRVEQTPEERTVTVFGVFSNQKGYGWACNADSIGPEDIEMLANLIKDEIREHPSMAGSQAPSQFTEFWKRVDSSRMTAQRFGVWDAATLWVQANPVEAVVWWQGRRAKQARAEKHGK